MSERKGRRWVIHTILRRIMRLGVLALPVVLFALSQWSSWSRGLDIHEGPVVMSDAERVLAPDPQQGSEQGICLVWESERDETDPDSSRVTLHVRAKIHSNDGRGLGDVEIPLDPKNDKLEKWWGRTILPDGKVLEVAKTDLEKQSVLSTRDSHVSVMRAALPGVVPGCVIDYGYQISLPGRMRWVQVTLQSSWPIRSFRLRWVPGGKLRSAYRLAHANGLSLHAEWEEDAVLVKGTDLPAGVTEPFMPPDSEVRASIRLYYLSRTIDDKDFWNDLARGVDRTSAQFSKHDVLLNEAIREMSLAPDADLMTRLRVAYGWIAKNIRKVRPVRCTRLPWQSARSAAPVATAS